MDHKKKTWIKEHGAKVAAVTGGVAALAGIAISAKAGVPVAKVINGKDLLGSAAKVVQTGSEVATEAAKGGGEVAKEVATKAPRYQVQMKALKTGEWYTKTVTDSVAAAHSVATTCAGPRASRVIDTLENVITNVNPGEAASYAQYLK